MEIPAIRFKQWLSLWDKYDYDAGAHRRKPESHLYLFTMKAAELRQISDVYRRRRDGELAEGIQRRRDDSRTARIQRYVKYGYPYGDLRADQNRDEFSSLRKPGWLPTAIVVNILRPGEQRHGQTINTQHVITIKKGIGSSCALVIPPLDSLQQSHLAPLEVIDGQHRLWAFEETDSESPVPDDFELPVVAYHGLDIAWQAYLFWSINVSPKRINPSHAFDLYPLLRTQDWLEQAGDLKVYREARAQELTECMYINEQSPWCGRINMLGERGMHTVSQAAWVRSLTSTFFSTGQGSGRMGLFQAKIRSFEEPLEWTRGQQAAFLIQVWRDLRDEIARSAKRYLWIRLYDSDPRAAFAGKTSILNQDMGVRAVSSVVNDIFFRKAVDWKLIDWYMPPLDDEGLTISDEANLALDTLQKMPFRSQIRETAEGLARFDWRSLEGPGLENDENEQMRKRSYRGSGGYTALQQDVLREISEGRGPVSTVAASLRVN
jgi:DGQHR domain-containing protein